MRARWLRSRRLSARVKIRIYRRRCACGIGIRRAKIAKRDAEVARRSKSHQRLGIDRLLAPHGKALEIERTVELKHGI